jgi:hypothetical protein
LNRLPKRFIPHSIEQERDKEGDRQESKEDEKGDIMIVIEFSNPLGGLVKMGVFIEIERGGLSPF